MRLTKAHSNKKKPNTEALVTSPPYPHLTFCFLAFYFILFSLFYS